MTTGEWVGVAVVGVVLVAGTGIALHLILRAPPAPLQPPPQVGSPFGVPSVGAAQARPGGSKRGGGSGLITKEQGGALGAGIGTAVGGPIGTVVGGIAGGILGGII